MAEEEKEPSPLPPSRDFTQLLLSLREGKRGADKELFSLVYDELHALAGRYMVRERPNHTLQATALVHEAYIRLGGEREEAFENRAHFLKVAAKAMRRVLIDHARRRRSEKREGKWDRRFLDEAALSVEDRSIDLLELESALDKLTTLDPQLTQVVELKFFAGLTVEDTAKVLDVSTGTVHRSWMLAKGWLKQKMKEGRDGHT